MFQVQVLQTLHDCARVLREGWSGPWLEQYRYQDQLYASFGEETGQIHCFKRGSLLYAETVPCNQGNSVKNEILKAAFVDNLDVYLMNCLDVFKNVTVESQGLVTQSIMIKAHDRPNLSFKLCFEVRVMSSIPIFTECPGSIRWYKIQPKNFIFREGMHLIFISPTVGQYEYLKKINHPSVVDESSYEYSHENEYFASY